MRLPDADPRAEDHPAALVERRPHAGVADRHPSVNRLEDVELATLHPAGRPVRELRQPDPDPRRAVGVRDAVEHLDRVPVELRRPIGDLGHSPPAPRRARARDRVPPNEGPAVRLRRPVAEHRALRIDARRIRRPGWRLVRAADADHDRPLSPAGRCVGRGGERHPVLTDLRPARGPRESRLRRVPVRVGEDGARGQRTARPDPNADIRNKRAGGEAHRELGLRGNAERRRLPTASEQPTRRRCPSERERPSRARARPTPAAAIATTETRRNVRTQGIVICMSRGRSPETAF